MDKNVIVLDAMDEEADERRPRRGNGPHWYHHEFIDHIHPWYGWESIHAQWPTLAPPIRQFPDKRIKDGAKLYQMLHGTLPPPEPRGEPQPRPIVELVSNHILYKRWPHCTGCAKEVVIAILVAKRNWISVETRTHIKDSVYSAWPFCSQCLADAISMAKLQHPTNQRCDEKCHILPATSRGLKPLVFLGKPSMAALEIAEREFDFNSGVGGDVSGDEAEEDQQQMQAASLLLTQGQKRSRRAMESGQ